MKSIQIKEIIKAVDGRLLWGEEEQNITSVSTNSKEIKKGALFVPIIGERVDAHDFMESAFSQGAVAAFTSRHKTKEECGNQGTCIYVKDTQKALQDFAAYYRSLFTLPIIGITGSVGKTTTKEMIAAALGMKYKVLKTAGNMNSQVGLPLMMFHIEEDTQIAVIEMGMSEEGEMKRLAYIARPETVVMTNIGVSHIGQLGSQENIRREKLTIINTFKEGNRLYLNAEDPLLWEIGKNPEISMWEETKKAASLTKYSYYGLGKSPDARAENIEIKGKETFFDFILGDCCEPIILSVLGIHNVENAVAALAVAKQYGIDPKIAKIGLKAYEPMAMRGQIFENKGIRIIDDTYNASPDSMKSGIHVLLEMKDLKRRIAVLADILELGEISESCHYEVGEYIAKERNQDRQINMLVTVGKEAKAIGRGAKEALSIYSFDTGEEAIAFLLENTMAGDGILVKGSRGMHMEKVVEALSREE
ncbi:MAG: UDP-N-acetylmuramoyl-tripeptide--D-alanyl-D-alanine ligase [Acetivibrio sp.]